MPGAVVELWRDAYVALSLEEDGRIVRFRRLAQSFPDLQVAAAVYDKVVATYDRIGRSGRALLIDTREAAGRNDSEFESLLLEFRRRSIHGFVGHVILVRTFIGTLQAQRIEQRQTQAVLVTPNEADAVNRLLALMRRP